MKKSLTVLSVISALVLTIVSCKNKEESKLIDTSVQNSNTTKGDSLNHFNSPATPLINVLEQPSTENLTGIYQSSDGAYHLVYNLEKGKTYNFNIREVNTQTQTLSASGKDENGEKKTVNETSKPLVQESIEPLSFTVSDFTDGVYTLQVKMGGRKLIMKADGKQQTILDTNGKQPTNPEQARLWKMYKAISELSFIIKMNINGSILQVSGFESIYDKAKNAVKNDLKGKELTEFINDFKKGVNENVFKAQFENSLMKFPAEGVKVGGKWNNDPAMKGKGYNQLVSVDTNTAVVKLYADIPSQSQSDKKDGVSLKASLTGSQSGKISLDIKSGWVSKGTLTTSVTESQTASKDGDYQKVTNKVVTNIYIN